MPALGIIGALAAAAGTAATVYSIANAPEIKSPVTARERVNEIESKLLPKAKEKLANEQKKATPDQDKLREYQLAVQDLEDEKAILSKQIDALHAEATGDVSSKDSATTTTTTTSPQAVTVTPLTNQLSPGVILGATVAVVGSVLLLLTANRK